MKIYIPINTLSNVLNTIPITQTKYLKRNNNVLIETLMNVRSVSPPGDNNSPLMRRQCQ